MQILYGGSCLIFGLLLGMSHYSALVGFVFAAIALLIGMGRLHDAFNEEMDQIDKENPTP